MLLCFCFIFIVFSVANSKTDRGDETETPQTSVETSKSQYLVNLDGKQDDWADVEPLWEEGGAEGPGAFAHHVDIKQVRFKNDNQYLYVLMRCSPTVVERFELKAAGGIICDLYFDIDDDSSTGSGKVAPFDSEKFKGFEVRVWVSIGVDASSKGTLPYVAYEIRKLEDKKFSFRAA